MIDVLNYTINGYPVLIYTLMFASAGILTYATVYSGASLGLSDSPGAPAPGAPVAAAPAVAAAPVAAPAPPQGGRRNRKSKRNQSRSKKNRSKHLRK
jgi:hypothetical protein